AETHFIPAIIEVSGDAGPKVHVPVNEVGEVTMNLMVVMSRLLDGPVPADVAECTQDLAQALVDRNEERRGTKEPNEVTRALPFPECPRPRRRPGRRLDVGADPIADLLVERLPGVRSRAG